MSERERIFQRIHDFRNEMIDLQVKLCSCPAVSPESGGDGEAEKAKILISFLDSCGFDKTDVVKAPDLDTSAGYRPNILARYKGRDSSKTIWIITHMDVVPPGELALWNGNPYKAWVEDGKIYGRGVEDNQQDMVASLFSVKAFQEEGIKPNFDIGIALLADEETGQQKGIDYVLKQVNPFRKQDLIIVPDVGNREGTMIEVAEKSVLWLTFKTLGIQAHGSTPEQGKNSFRAASHFIVELNRLYEIFDFRDPLFDPPISTFEPTKKEANVPNINTIPGEDVFHMDCRVLAEYSLDEVESAILEMAEKIEKLFGVKISMEEAMRESAAPPTPDDAPVVQALQDAVQAVYGIKAEPAGIGGGTIASSFRQEEYLAACWSRTDETAHKPNEYCIIDNMVGDSKVFAHLFLQK